jgi:uncharacterized membrane protein YciS (DUF1049 family)
MIGIVITILIVCTIVSIKATLTIRKTDKRIKELENELNEYYNRRENRLLKRFKDIENG